MCKIDEVDFFNSYNVVLLELTNQHEKSLTKLQECRVATVRIKKTTNLFLFYLFRFDFFH